MEIKKNVNNGVLSVSVSGRIDTATAPSLENELKDSVGDCESLVLDFSEVNYISSAGLRVLLLSHKAMSRKGGLKLKNVTEPIMEILEVTGFTDILDIEKGK